MNKVLIMTGGGRGIGAAAARLDVSVESEVRRLFAEVDRSLGRVTALVNNAGGVDRGTRVASGDPGQVERIGATAPLQRPGEPEEVARAMVWLLSEEASYITGAILDVAGGR